jgi:hypothetical protein
LAGCRGISFAAGLQLHETRRNSMHAVRRARWFFMSPPFSIVYLHGVSREQPGFNPAPCGADAELVDCLCEAEVRIDPGQTWMVVGGEPDPPVPVVASIVGG